MKPARKLCRPLGVRPVTSVTHQLMKPAQNAPTEKSATQSRWGMARMSRKKTVSLERRRSSVTTSRTG
jgi:hypothetical protein